MAAAFGLITVPGWHLMVVDHLGFRRDGHDQETSRHEEPGAEQDQGERDPGPVSAANVVTPGG